jgi:hypothetical protein
MVVRGLTCHPAILSVCMSGLYLAFFFVVCNVWGFVVTISAFNELYEI